MPLELAQTKSRIYGIDVKEPIPRVS